MDLTELNKTRKLYQIGIVVKDLDEALKRWTEIYHVGPWKIMTHSNKYLADAFTDKSATCEEWQFRVALTMMGDSQLELIEPEYGIPLYQDYLEKHGEGIHHFKEIMSNEELDKRLAEYKEQGVKILFGGDFYGARFYYPDTVPSLGVQIELGNGMPANLPADYTHARIYP